MSSLRSSESSSENLLKDLSAANDNNKNLSSSATLTRENETTTNVTFSSNTTNNNQKKRSYNRLPNYRASFHGFSNIPPKQPPPPRLTKQKPPPISLNEDEGTENNDTYKRTPLYSPERSSSFERFTRTILAEPNTNAGNAPTNIDTNTTLNNAYTRPRPRLRRIDDDYTPALDRGTRQYKSKSLYLEVLNRRSFVCPVTTLDEPDNPMIEEVPLGNNNSRLNLNHPHHHGIADAALKSQQILRNVSGYATLPRRYKPKPSKK